MSFVLALVLMMICVLNPFFMITPFISNETLQELNLKIAKY